MKNFLYGVAAALAVLGWLIVVFTRKGDAGFVLLTAAWIFAVVGYHKGDA